MRVSWPIVLAVVTAAGAAHADEAIRAERPLLVAVGLPDVMRMVDKDVTFPLPAIRIGYDVARRTTVELDVGGVPLPYGAHAAIAHVGVRRAFGDGAFAPYAVARAGVYDDSPDEGDGGRYPFVVGGGGIEYAGSSGLSAWLELETGVASFENLGERSAEWCIAGSAGIGYRFRTR